jgi:4,5-dihydroxyphthalate decarboxylase
VEKTLVYAGSRYLDRTRGLELGEIVPKGVGRLAYSAVDDLAQLFNAMAVDPPYEAAEMSLSFLLMMVARGDDRLVAIPVFPSRSFRHNQIYVRTAAGVMAPSDLRGKRVGAPEYHMTAALWIRAALEHDHGVRASDMDWFVGERRPPRFPFDHPNDVSLTSVGDPAILDSMLVGGEIDALITSTAPPSYTSGDRRVSRLFPDYRAVERDYFQRTGIFPIMHVVVIRRDVYERDRRLALSLLNAFETSKAMARHRLVQLGTLAVMHPWLGAELAELTEAFGGDPFAYGFDANKRVIEAAARYSHEQGLSAREIDPAELFASETVTWSPPQEDGPVQW